MTHGNRSNVVGGKKHRERERASVQSSTIASASGPRGRWNEMKIEKRMMLSCLWCFMVLRIHIFQSDTRNSIIITCLSSPPHLLHRASTRNNIKSNIELLPNIKQIGLCCPRQLIMIGNLLILIWWPGIRWQRWNIELKMRSLLLSSKVEREREETGTAKNPKCDLKICEGQRQHPTLLLRT